MSDRATRSARPRPTASRFQRLRGGATKLAEQEHVEHARLEDVRPSGRASSAHLPRARLKAHERRLPRILVAAASARGERARAARDGPSGRAAVRAMAARLRGRRRLDGPCPAGVFRAGNRPSRATSRVDDGVASCRARRGRLASARPFAVLTRSSGRSHCLASVVVSESKSSTDARVLGCSRAAARECVGRARQLRREKQAQEPPKQRQPAAVAY